LKQKIQENSKLIEMKLQEKKIKIEKEKKIRQELQILSELKEKKETLIKKNEKMKNTIELVKIKIKTEESSYSELKSKYEQYFNSAQNSFMKDQEKYIEIETKTKTSLIHKLNKEKKIKCKEIMEIFPLSIKGNNLCILNDSIQIPLSFQKLELNQPLNHALHYLSLILSLFYHYLNIESNHKIHFNYTNPSIELNSKMYPLYFESGTINEKDFRFGLQLFNEMVLNVCHHQGIIVLEENKNNFQINFLTLFHYENIGSSGPFVYYTISNSNEILKNAKDNYFISKDSIKFIQIVEKEKTDSVTQQPKGKIEIQIENLGFFIDSFNDHFNSLDDNVESQDQIEIKEITDYF
jgi:hypothetical protein